jgi:protein O-GlcNAc transferase
LLALDRCDEAVTAYAAMLAKKPDQPQTLMNQGAALLLLKRSADALASYERALVIVPDDTDALLGRAHALVALARHEEAAAAYERVLARRPDDAEALAGRGNALSGLGRHEDAVACYDSALALEPERADVLGLRGNCLHKLKRLAEADDSFARAVAIDPDNWTLKLAKCMAHLPELYDDAGQIDQSRAAYERELRALSAEAEAGSALALADAVGHHQPFFLPYQERDDLALQSLYGDMVCRAMRARHPPMPLAAPPADGELIRLGFICGFFYQHTIWRLFAGWLARLDRQKFALFGYHTGASHDAMTDAAAAHCTRFVEGFRPVADWRAAIAADRPHVLIYPEIGMDPVAGALAALRLSPVQCMAWGHPNTSGYPTIDYFLSSDLMEPPDSAARYRERLIRLPNLSIWYDVPQTRELATTRADYGIRAGATAYLCCQSLFKYLPQYDDVFPRIARAVPDCQFVFIEHQRARSLTDQFRRRLERAFAAHGLAAAGHCTILPRVTRAEFIHLWGLCEVALDSIGWSGGNTTLEGMTHAIPVVALDGAFMRGRHTAAMLRMMGVEETIAHSLDDYVAIAARLGRDTAWQEAVRSNVAATKHKLYRDRACIAALEEFLLTAVRGVPRS